MSNDAYGVRRLNSDRGRVGSRLILAAWGIEIVAAAIGILLATVTLLTAVEKLQGEKGSLSTSDWSNAWLGSLPFIIVAIVELTKIPLATATYFASSVIWRTIFVIGLLFLMLVTAETVYNGFERQFTLRNAVIQELNNQVATDEESISALEARNKELSALTRESIQLDFEATLETISRETRQRLDEIAEREAGVLAEHGGERGSILSDKISAANAQITALREDLKSERNRIESGFITALDSISSNVTAESDILTQEISQIDSQKNALRQQIAEMRSKPVDTSNIDEGVRKAIAELEAQYEELRSNVSGEIEAQRAGVADEISRIESQIADIRQSKREEEGRLFTDDSRVNKLDGQINDALNEIDDLLAQQRGLTATERLSELAERQQDHKQRIEDEADKRRNELRDGALNQTAPLLAEVRELDQRRLQLTDQLADASLSARTQRLQEDRNGQIAELEARYNASIAEQQAVIDASRNELLELASNNQEALEAIRTQISNNRVSANTLAEQRRTAANVDKDRRLDELQKTEVVVRDNEQEIATLRDEVVALRSRIATEAQDSQIYRVAALMFAESAADVSNEELRIVSFVWFGSLAAIVAWTGTLLAFGGLVAKYGGETIYRRKSVVWGMRALIADVRRKVREPKIEIREKEVPKEVVREVPVEKIVIKEVPKDVVVKELVYVPFFSDDAELLSSQRITSADLARFPRASKTDVKGNDDEAIGEPDQKTRSKKPKKKDPTSDSSADDDSDVTTDTSEQAQMDLGRDSK